MSTRCLSFLSLAQNVTLFFRMRDLRSKGRSATHDPHHQGQGASPPKQLGSEVMSATVKTCVGNRLKIAKRIIAQRIAFQLY